MHFFTIVQTNVEDQSLQCPSTQFGPSINIPPSKQPPSNPNPKLKMKASLEVLNLNFPSQEATSIGRTLSLQEVKLDG